ncbi:GNAT family N-acetyltransferase [Cuneatibacter caecimuris]|uniref:Acetyltransferase (GNAT) family protein n=1 Tax=Cuneatibacter caecimuris TaxID=1796618 RepID=A0A4Q7PMK2_9FIRM|nr:GNAT family N-acetyltransferase [Cuneatibacter caecimuris]RZT02171.1 acetyltransferase (GNAT) family protein [Cuneatibacter caecimuris]
MEYLIRAMKREEFPLLNDFLYEAIFIPKGAEPPPKSITNLPELQVYVAGFGNSERDRAFAAVVDEQIVGAAWVRMINDYGHIDDNTPSLAISLYKEYRGLGIGTALLKTLLRNLKSTGYSKVSLSVQKDNYAVKIYEKAGFAIFHENEEEYIMVADLTL